jgi:dTDP-4-dehydrorhamnose reductase
VKILLLGANGQVGWELARALAPLGEVVATTRAQLDLTSEPDIRNAVRAVNPTWVVNAAAYTAVDAAESEPHAARWLNAEVPRILAEEAVRAGAWMVHYSTDYVFDGRGTRPYVEHDLTGPLGVYGATKHAGDVAVHASGVPHLLLRVAWVYGTRGRNFLRTMQKLSRERELLRVVADQIGVPTWSRHIAEATALMMAQRPSVEQSGTYHLAGEGSCSWYDFAEAIVRSDPDPGARVTRIIEPIASSEYPTAAHRPSYSVLNAKRAQQVFGVQLPPWEAQLALCLVE